MSENQDSRTYVLPSNASTQTVFHCVTPNSNYKNSSNFFLNEQKNQTNTCNQSIQRAREQNSINDFDHQFADSGDEIANHRNAYETGANRSRSSEKEGLKLRQSSREVGQRITLSVLEEYYNMPLIQAAKELKVSNTMLKKLCRRYKIQRWPHRQIRSIDKEIKKHEENLATPTPPTECALAQQKIEQLKEKRNMVTKMASCGLNASLRSAIFQARPGEIDAEQIFSSGIIPAFQAKSSRVDNSQPLPGVSNLNQGVVAAVESKNQRILPKNNAYSAEDSSTPQGQLPQLSSPYPMSSNWMTGGGMQNNYVNYMNESRQYHQIPNYSNYPPISHIVPSNDKKQFQLVHQQSMAHSIPFTNNPSMNQLRLPQDRSIPQYMDNNVIRLPSLLDYSCHREEL